MPDNIAEHSMEAGEETTKRSMQMMGFSKNVSEWSAIEGTKETPLAGSECQQVNEFAGEKEKIMTPKKL